MYSVSTKWDPCNEHHLAHTIREHKRIDRLRQVRAQARDVAAQIRRSFQEERERAVKELEERENRRKEAELRMVLNAAEQEYVEAVNAVGRAQREAEQRQQEASASDRAEQQREEEARRKQRFIEAREALQRDRDSQRALEVSRARARERALQAERERAIAVASRSPPSPNPLDKLQRAVHGKAKAGKGAAEGQLAIRRSQPVAVTDRDAFSTTHFHLVPVGDLVRRSADSARSGIVKDEDADEAAREDAQRAAESIEKQLAELAAERQRSEAERRERARERGAAALRRETLRKHYTELLGDLSTLQRLDTHRKAAHFYHVPRSLFLGNRQSDVERAREQRRMEERLERLVEHEPVVLSTTLPLRVEDERARGESPIKAVGDSARLRTSSVSPAKEPRAARATRSANASPSKSAARMLRFGREDEDEDDEVEPQPRSRPLSALDDVFQDRSEPVPQHLASLYAQLRGARLDYSSTEQQPQPQPPARLSVYAESRERAPRTVERAASPIRLVSHANVEVEAEAEADRTLVEEEVQTDRLEFDERRPQPNFDAPAAGSYALQSAVERPAPVPRLPLASTDTYSLPPTARTYDVESARTTNRLLEASRLRMIASEQLREIDAQLATYRERPTPPADTLTSRSTSRASDAIETMRHAEPDRTSHSANGNLTLVQRSRVDSSSSSNPRATMRCTFDAPSGTTLDLTLESASSRSDESKTTRSRIRDYQRAALNRLRTAQSSSLPSAEVIECAVPLAPPKQLDRSPSALADHPDRPALYSRDASVRLGSSFTVTGTNISSVPSTKSPSPVKAGPQRSLAADSDDALRKLATASDWQSRLERYRQALPRSDQLHSPESRNLADYADDDLANDAFVPHQLSVIREADGTSRFIVSTSQFQRSLLASASSKRSPSNVANSLESTIELSEHTHSSISMMTPLSNAEQSKDPLGEIRREPVMASARREDNVDAMDIERVKKLALLRYLHERSAQLASANTLTTTAASSSSSVRTSNDGAPQDAVDGTHRSDSGSLAPATLSSPNDDPARGEALRTLMQSALTIDLAALSASYSSAISSRSASQLNVPHADATGDLPVLAPLVARNLSNANITSQKFDSPTTESELERDSSRRQQTHDYSTSSVMQTHAPIEKSMLSQLSLSTIENSGSPSSVVRVATETSSSSDSPHRFAAAETTPHSTQTQTQSTVTPGVATSGQTLVQSNDDHHNTSADDSHTEGKLGELGSFEIGALPHDESADTETDISLISLSSAASVAPTNADLQTPVSNLFAETVRSTIEARRDALQPDALRIAELVLSAQDDSLIRHAQDQDKVAAKTSTECALDREDDSAPCTSNASVSGSHGPTESERRTQSQSDDTLTDSEAEEGNANANKRSYESDPNNNSNDERSSSGRPRSRNVVRFDERVQEFEASLSNRSAPSKPFAKREPRRRSSQEEVRRPPVKSVRSRSVSADRVRRYADQERAYRERTKRLWNQLDEVRQKREERNRKQQYAANRERAQQYAKRIDERRRKSSSQASPSSSQVHSD